MDPALVPDFEGRYLENEKRFFKNNFETLYWGPNSIIRNQLVKTLQLTFKYQTFHEVSEKTSQQTYSQQKPPEKLSRCLKEPTNLSDRAYFRQFSDW